MAKNIMVGQRVRFVDRKGREAVGTVTIVGPEGNMCPYLEVRTDDGKTHFVDEASFKGVVE